VTSPSLTEQLANLPIIYILYFVVAATVIRLAMLRQPAVSARSVAEFMESAVIAVVLVFLILRPFVVQAYFIPSPSMVPTLLGKNGSGDRILVNKLLYRIAKPQHDDVVVFIPPPLATDNTPEETSGVPVNFIKRLIAKPNDVLIVHAGRLIINGKKYSHQNLRDALNANGFFKSDSDGGSDDSDLQADHHIKFKADGAYVDGTKMSDSDIARYLTQQPSAPVQVVPGQTIINGKVLDEPFIAEDPDYDLKIYKGESLKNDMVQGMRLDGQHLPKIQYDADNAAPAEPIPPGKYFMMGDNRNDSKDSTEWGPLGEERIVGKAQVIFWPLSRVRAIH